MTDTQKVAQLVREREHTVHSIDEYVDMLTMAVEEIRRLSETEKPVPARNFK